MNKKNLIIALSIFFSFNSWAESFHSINVYNGKTLNEVCLMNILQERFDYITNAPAEDTLKKPLDFSKISSIQNDPHTVTYFNEGLYFYTNYNKPDTYYFANKTTLESFEFTISHKPGVSRCFE